MIKVTICTGTTCYVMGNANLLVLKDDLSEKLKKKVEFEGHTCLQSCKDEMQGNPPFVMINGKIMSDANFAKVKAEIKRLAAE